MISVLNTHSSDSAHLGSVLYFVLTISHASDWAHLGSVLFFVLSNFTRHRFDLYLMFACCLELVGFQSLNFRLFSHAARKIRGWNLVLALYTIFMMPRFVGIPLGIFVLPFSCDLCRICVNQQFGTFCYILFSVLCFMLTYIHASY